jgi:hypothetical protein
MSNEESYDLLDAAEDDLIDDFLAGKLNARERKQFMQRFLASPERKRKLQFGDALKRFVEMAEKKGATGPKPFPVWQKTYGFFSNRMANAYAMAAMIAVLLIGAPLFYLRITDLRKELNHAAAQLSNVEQEREELKDQLVDNQSLSDRLKSPIHQLEQAFTNRKAAPSSLALLTLKLNPGMLRGSNHIPEITISSGFQSIEFSLTLLDDYYDHYRVTLFDAERRELLTRYRLKPKATGQGKSIVLTVPGELLSAGEYSLSLAGISDSEPPESINNFYFRSVTR